MAMDPEIMGTETIRLNGIVIDDEGNPINHIRITLEWDDQAFSPLTSILPPTVNSMPTSTSIISVIRLRS